jgi:hypothetical protein
MAILPTRILEIEFDAGTWTDVTAYAVSVGTRRGRNRESGAFETGRMVFTLRNDDRRFDPDHAAGPYYGKLRPNRRVRFRATYTLTFPIFQGYLDRITQNYGGPNDATATFEVSDMFKLLNRVELPASVYTAEVSADAPTHWWRLGEPVGSTVARDKGSTAADGAYVGTVALGQAGAPVRDPDTAVSLDGAGAHVVIGSAGMVTGYPYTVELWLKISTRSTLGNWWFYAQNTAGGTSAPVGYVTGTDLGDPGKVRFDSITSTVRVDDNAWHHVVLKASAAGAGNQELYIDGVSQGTGTPTTPAGAGVWLGIPDHPAFSALTNRDWPGMLDEVAIYPTALSFARVGVHNSAGRTPWNGDTPGARLVRIFDLALVPVGDRVIGAGTTTLQATSLGGSALAYAQKVEETEAARLFVAADGRITFLGRQEGDTGTYLTSQATLVDADSGAGRGYRFTSADVDEGTIVTRATVSREGSVALTYGDAAAQAEFKIIDEVHSGLLHNDDAYSLYYAQWIVNTHKTPATRTGTVELALPADPTNMYPDIFGLEIGDRVTYKRKPQNVGAIVSLDMRVEAIEHATGAHYWNTRLQLSPFNLGTSGYGVGVWDSSLWDQAVWGL